MLESRIIGVLKEVPKIRDELVKILGIPRTTIYDALRKLIEKDIIERAPLRDYIPIGDKCIDCKISRSNKSCSIKDPKNCVNSFKPKTNKKRGRPYILFRLVEGE